MSRGCFMLFLLLVSGLAKADDWAAATTREVFSQSRDYFVRVAPG